MIDANQEQNENRLDCLATLCWLKRSSRTICKEIIEYRYQKNKRRREKELLKQKHSPFNCHRIKKLDEKIQEIESKIDCMCHELGKIGERVTEALYHTESILSFHDKCQVIGRSHQAIITEMVEACIPANTSFYCMVTVYGLECAGKYDPEFTNEDEYNPSMPLAAATNEYLLHTITHNKEFHAICERVVADTFPHLPLSAFQDSNSKRQPPMLRLL